MSKVKRFSEEENRHWPERAYQLWIILVGMANNWQITSYGWLAELVGFKGSGVFADPLGHIAAFCILNDLPLLTTLVVKTEGGEPGSGIPIDSDEIDAERMRVLNYDWYDVVPPTPAELEEAYEEYYGQP